MIGIKDFRFALNSNLNGSGAVRQLLRAGQEQPAYRRKKPDRLAVPIGQGECRDLRQFGPQILAYRRNIGFDLEYSIKLFKWIG